MEHCCVDILTPPTLSKPRFWVKSRAVQRASATFLCPSRPTWIFFQLFWEHGTRWGYLDYQVNAPAVVDRMPFSLVRNAQDDFLCITPQIIPHPTITVCAKLKKKQGWKWHLLQLMPIGRTWCSTWSSRALGRADCAAPSVWGMRHGEEGLSPHTTVPLFLVSNYSGMKLYLFLSALLRWFLDTKCCIFISLLS